LYEKCVGKHHPNNTDVFIVAVGKDVFQKSLELSERLRDSLQNLRVEVNLGGGGFKSQLKRADKSGASYAIIIGEDELQEGVYGLKPLRSDENQVTISCEKIIEELEKKIENNK
jgi:histidyl-tRNA synthetase